MYINPKKLMSGYSFKVDGYLETAQNLKQQSNSLLKSIDPQTPKHKQQERCSISQQVTDLRALSDSQSHINDLAILIHGCNTNTKQHYQDMQFKFDAINNTLNAVENIINQADKLVHIHQFNQVCDQLLAR